MQNLIGSDVTRQFSKENSTIYPVAQGTFNKSSPTELEDKNFSITKW